MATAVIIGAGVAGLSAGIRAQENGLDTVIVERHHTPGGNLTGWDRDGYHIDNCIHWLTGTNPLSDTYDLWRELGALTNEKVYQPDTLYTFRSDERELSLSRDISILEADMLSFSERDDKEIRAFVGAVKATAALSGFAGKCLNRRPTPAERGLALIKLRRYAMLSTGELSERFHSPMLRGFLRSLLSERFAAIALLSVFATFCTGNGDIPEGSSCRMAQRMAQRYESIGGRLLLNNGVKTILIQDKKASGVLLFGGRVIEADYVVIACEPLCAFGSMLDLALMPKKLRKRYEDRSLRRFSGFHCAFSCEEEWLDFHGDLIVELSRVLSEEFGSNYLVIREFSHEKRFSPEHKNLIQTICFCSEDCCRNFIRLREDDATYQMKKESLSDLILKEVERHSPATRGKLRLIDCWTPATYARYTGSPTGSFMSFILPKKKLPTFIDGRVKGVKNLFLASQWQQYPGGLPIAAKAGVKAAQRMIRIQQRSRAYSERKGSVFDREPEISKGVSYAPQFFQKDLTP